MTEHKPYPQEHQHFIQGREFERERIIALIQAERDAMRSSRSPSDWEQSYGLDIAIALIKGENE